MPQITGTADLNVAANGTGDVRIYSVLNNTGTLTNSGTGTGALTFFAGSEVGSNVTSIIQASNTSKIVFNPYSNLVVGAGGLTLTATGTSQLNEGGGVSGTGNLILNTNNNSTGISINSGGGAIESVNNSGLIINSGTGTATTSINAVPIGSNVTGITQSSNTSALTIGSASNITVNGNGTTLTATGTALMSVAGGFLGTGNLVLNSNNNSNGILISTTAVNNV